MIAASRSRRPAGALRSTPESRCTRSAALAAFALHTPIGANAARLGTLAAGPLAALLLADRRVLLAAAAPLLYLQFQPPIRDLVDQAGDPSTNAAYYRPLLRFLRRQPGPPFRIEIPPTRFHYETYEVAPHFVLARGWERQLDIRYDQLFYGGPLTAADVRRVAAPLRGPVRRPRGCAARLRGAQEVRLIEGGLPYLSAVSTRRHWRVYEVADPMPIVTGAATLTGDRPELIHARATRPGEALVRVRFTPTGRSAGIRMRPLGRSVHRGKLRHAGTARLTIRFALGRIGADPHGATEP